MLDREHGDPGTSVSELTDVLRLCGLGWLLVSVSVDDNILLGTSSMISSSAGSVDDSDGVKSKETCFSPLLLADSNIVGVVVIVISAVVMARSSAESDDSDDSAISPSRSVVSQSVSHDAIGASFIFGVSSRYESTFVSLAADLSSGNE